MKSLNLSRCALSVCVAAALLAACGGSGQPPISVASSQIDALQATNARSAEAALRSVSFYYTGAQQNFTVPTGVTHVIVQDYGGASGPAGGYVKATIPVTPGESLAIFVGGNGSRGAGGFNGGGNGGNKNGEGGAGASDIRQGGNALANRVVVAGGAGGAGSGLGGGAGGDGGGLVGGAGANGLGYGGGGGGGGAQSFGGAGGSGNGHGVCRSGNGGNGLLGAGGSGGYGGTCHGFTAAGGGGGGGGYYGGGGGGGSSGPHWGAGGGGGGSSYIERSAKNVTNQQGRSIGGLIIISWRSPT